MDFTVTDLLAKIGALSLEVDLLRQQLAEGTAQNQAPQPDAQRDTD